jgi:3-oxoacyl-[acyl-carrier-protein] synthase II
MVGREILPEPVVITGIGLLASTGLDRESVWRSVQCGRSNFRYLTGLRGIPDGELIGATVDLPAGPHGQLKVLSMCDRAAAEAIEDADVDWSSVDRERFACAISGHMGDASLVERELGLIEPDEHWSWHEQWFPDTACTTVGRKYNLGGPRLSHSTACASSLISVLSATRAIRDHQCDIALAGGAEAIHPLILAGFDRMRVLARDLDPQRACRPFDLSRKGFVFGEGAAIFVLERLGHALRRGARIYAEVTSVKSFAQAHHVTSLDAESDSLSYLIGSVLDDAGVEAADVGYINAHGTATEQNDLAESLGIRRAFGASADDVCVSATKSVLGHMINAAGAAELAITALALRDGFAPPTMNLVDPDPACNLNCLPLVGRRDRFQHALKLSLAFGGHLVGVLLSRWNDSATGFAYPSISRAA